MFRKSSAHRKRTCFAEMLERPRQAAAKPGTGRHQAAAPGSGTRQHLAALAPGGGREQRHQAALGIAHI